MALGKYMCYRKEKEVVLNVYHYTVTNFVETWNNSFFPSLLCLQLMNARFLSQEVPLDRMDEDCRSEGIKYSFLSLRKKVTSHQTGGSSKCCFMNPPLL